MHYVDILARTRACPCTKLSETQKPTEHPTTKTNAAHSNKHQRSALQQKTTTPKSSAALFAPTLITLARHK
jgi:hypothetical protein